MLKIISPNGTACLYLKSAQDYLQNGGDVADYYKDKKNNDRLNNNRT